MQQIRQILFVLFILVPGINIYSQLPAFPGAEGGGMYTTGGRGGDVYFVTTLDDNETGNATTKEGSLRWCLTTNEGSTTKARTILFKVSGTIHLDKALRIQRPELTIAGQSAPGEGVCIAGYPVTVDADNVIIRYLRFRMGDEKISPGEADGADALGGRRFKNVIVDHCSLSWCTDECASFYECHNFTLQWCIISESLRLSKHDKGPHGYGGIWGGTNSSFHHNLLAHHDSRNPRLGPGLKTEPLTETVDMRNNVIYNWASNTCYAGEAMLVNIINNYYKPGPATPMDKVRGRIVAIDKDTRNPDSKRYNIWGKFYIDGNIIDGTDIYAQATNRDNWQHGVYNQYHSSNGTVTDAEKEAMRISAPHPFYPVTTHTAAEAYDKVLAYAGASLHRDTYDQRIVEETRTGTATFKGLSPYNGESGKWKSVGYPKPGIIDSQKDLRPANAGSDWSPWPELKQSAIPVDSDRDGVPDSWMEKHYPGKKGNEYHPSGYTYLELYLNSMVEKITEDQNTNSLTEKIIVVDQQGKGDFTRIQDAINHVRAFDPNGTTTILIKNGIYKEKLEIPTFISNVCLKGEDKERTIITFDDHAKINDMGTFRSYTMIVRANDITLENLTIENNAEPVAQAVTLHLEGDRVIIRNCRLLGNQDTVYTGREACRHYFEDCYIEGTTDYIFGPSTCWFENCELHCKKNSYITAASTPASIPYGYIFNNCIVTTATDVTSMYLGRPWRAYAMTLFMNCDLPGAILKEGWHNWGKTENEVNSRYLEYNNRGTGSDTNGRVTWAKQLTTVQASQYTIENVMKGCDGWNPLEMKK